MKPYMLTDDYRIGQDERNFTLERRHTVQKGKEAGTEKWVTEGWYPHLDMVARAAVKRLVLESEEELPEALREAVALFEGLRAERLKEVP